MRLTFLGSGAATAPLRHNAAIAVGNNLLLDGGAPLHVTLSQSNRKPDDIETVLLSHYHGDHTIGLGTFLVGRLLRGGPALKIVGPRGTEQHVDALCNALWGELWSGRSRRGFELEYTIVESGMSLLAAEYEVAVVRMEHDSGYYQAVPSVGYVLSDGTVRLGYAGDSAPGPWVDELLERSDAAIIECTGPSPGPTHLSESYVRELIHRHSRTQVFLTHFGAETPAIEGATLAYDLATFDVSIPRERV